MRTEEKKMRQNDIEAKEGIMCESVFIHLNLNRSHKFSLFPLDYFTNQLPLIK